VSYKDVARRTNTRTIEYFTMGLDIMTMVMDTDCGFSRFFQAKTVLVPSNTSLILIDFSPHYNAGHEWLQKVRLFWYLI
jgi:hypothetical protein